MQQLQIVGNLAHGLIRRLIFSPLYMLSAVPYIFLMFMFFAASPNSERLVYETVMTLLGKESGYVITETDILRLLAWLAVLSSLLFELIFRLFKIDGNSYETEFRFRVRVVIVGYLLFTIISLLISGDLLILAVSALFLLATLILLGVEKVSYLVLGAIRQRF